MSTLTSIIVVLIIIAASAKSAQIFMHNWLADAMAGPTPVSSLLHAATLVVSGAILLLKLSSICVYSISIIQLIGIVSALLGAIIAIAQSDAKSIIAYSTLSQFGYIISISTIGSESLAYLHISTHACFKSALFMCIGIVIHSSYDIQDIRLLGSYISIMPITYVCMLSCISSLIAIPYLSGNISKDMIIEYHSTQYGNYGIFITSIAILVASITTIYSVLLLLYSFITTTNSNRITYEYRYEANTYGILPILLLSILAISLAYIISGYQVSSNGINDSLIVVELWLVSIKYIPVIALIIGLICTYIAYTGTNTLPSIIDRSLYLRLYFDSSYALIHNYYLLLGSFIANSIDLGIIEWIIMTNTTSNYSATTTNQSIA